MRRTLSTTIAALVLATCAAVRADSTIDYTRDVEPIFKAHCFGCHGEQKGLGRLRLHTTDAIQEAMGVHADLLVAGKPDESELYKRLVLPAEDKKRMPKGADPLPEDNIATIKKWIEEGASFAVAASVEPPAMTDEPAAEAKPVPQRPPLEAAASDAMTAVEATGALVIPLYAGSNELRVSFPSSREEVNDDTVAKIVPLAGQLVELDLSGTKITDACGPSLAELKNVDTLHLEKTEVGDGAIAALSNLQYLNYLNLHSTKVTDAGLESLKPVASLRKLFLWHTAVSYEAAKALEKNTPGLVVNLGWDHPGVVRERLTKELASVEKQQADATAAVAEAEKSLAAAKADQQAAEARAAELKQQLEAVDKPAEPTEPAPPQSETAEPQA